MKKFFKFIFKKLSKFLLILCLIALILIVLGWIFIKLYRPFGGIPSKKDEEDYSRRSTNFKNGKFYNDNFSLKTKYRDTYADRTTGKQTTPDKKLDVEKYEYDPDFKKDGLYVTWFGHSSILLQMHGKNILIDPVLSDRSSPFSFVGPKRFSKLAVQVKDLPEIDIVVITHDHYDHLDYDTIKKLKYKAKKFIVPLGIEKDLVKFGIDKDKIVNMAWWEEIDEDGLLIACTPARHFSGRYILDSSKSLWASFVFKDENNTVYDSGDTGYGDHFKEINKKYGKFDLVLLDSGQYNGSWHEVHMFPEESVMAAKDLQAEVSMPIHWGAFVLSKHSWDDPVDRFTRRAKEEKIEYITPKIGQTVSMMNYDQYKTEWWKDIE